MVTGLDLGGVGDFITSLGSAVGIILLVFVVVLVFGAGGFFYYLKKLNKTKFNSTINLFKVVNGKKFWIGSDNAKEIVIPGTNVRLLYWKKKKIYSAYPTRSIGFNVYAYMLNRMGELTNFDLGEGEDETEAKIDYDHRDQTYAYLNLQEFITRNYKSKKDVSWWQQHLPLITIILAALLLGLEMWFFFSQSGKQLSEWTTIANTFKEASSQIATAIQQSKNLGSGVVVG